MDDLLVWLTACLDHLERNARAMLDLDWPREVWVTPADMQGWEEGDPVGLVSVHEYGPKRYARLNAARLRAGDPLIDHGWVVHETAQQVWSQDVARSVLARVEAERAIVRAHGNPDVDPCVSPAYDADGNAYEDGPCDVLRSLAYGHRYDYPGWQDSWVPDSAAHPPR